jgi:hypothetical protein
MALAGSDICYGYPSTVPAGTGIVYAPPEIGGLAIPMGVRAAATTVAAFVQ